MQDFFLENTYGKLSINPNLHAPVDITKPKSAYYNENGFPQSSTLVRDCVAAARVNVQALRHVMVLINDDLNGSWGGILDIGDDLHAVGFALLSYTNQRAHSLWAHEMGHAYRLLHSSG